MAVRVVPKLPAVVGVPESTQVLLGLLLQTSPGGALVPLQLEGGMPLDTVILLMYWIPTVPAESVEGVKVNGGGRPPGRPG